MHPDGDGRRSATGEHVLLCRRLLQLLGMLMLYWNSPVYTGEGYLQGALGWTMSPPKEFELPFSVREEEYEAALAEQKADAIARDAVIPQNDNGQSDHGVSDQPPARAKAQKLSLIDVAAMMAM